MNDEQIQGRIMSVNVRIPTPLLNLTAGKKEVSANAGQLKKIIDTLESEYPGLKDRLIDEAGELRRFVNIYIDEEDIRFLKGLETDVSEGSEVSIIPAVAGGRTKMGLDD